MKKQITVIVVTVLIAVGLSGCFNSQSSEKNKFVGTWHTKEKQYLGENYTDIVIFFSDDSLTITTMYGMGNTPGSWELKDGKLVMTTIFQIVYDYSFSEEGNTLTLTSVIGEDTIIYYRE